MYSKTFGDTMINGYDTDSNLDIVRKSLGICPQHNMLFPELTVGEHFTVFGMVRIVTHELKQIELIIINAVSTLTVTQLASFFLISD